MTKKAAPRACLTGLIAAAFLACSSSGTTPPPTTPSDAATTPPDSGIPQEAAATDAAVAAFPPAGTEPIKRVLLLSIDGFHSSDMERYLKVSPGSNLARLAAVGARFTSPFAPFPSDSFPSVLAWATGGTPRSTGVFYDISYDRKLSPPSSTCAVMGTAVTFNEVADKDSTLINGGGGLDPAKLPRDPAKGCAVVYPHDYLRVNTIFEVAKAAGFRTAWSDKHLSYEVLHGPSGTGVDDLFNPEIASVNTKSLSAVESYDRSKADAVLAQIDGKDHTGAAASVPGLFGMNFQVVSVEQKAVGYVDAAGTPTPDLLSAIDWVDQAIGAIVTHLIDRGLWSSTVLVVTASHGQSPIDPAAVNRIATAIIPNLVNGLGAGTLAAATQDAVALLWLTDPSKTAAVAQRLTDQKASTSLDKVLSGPDIVAMFGDPATDSRIPHVIGVVKTGTIYTDSSKKVAEHGGFSDDDRKVALLVVGGTPGAVVNADLVETRQIAPTILSALGIDPQKLGAVQKEGTVVLPGLSFKH